MAARAATVLAVEVGVVPAGAVIGNRLNHETVAVDIALRGVCLGIRGVFGGVLVEPRKSCDILDEAALGRKATYLCELVGSRLDVGIVRPGLSRQAKGGGGDKRRGERCCQFERDVPFEHAVPLSLQNPLFEHLHAVNRPSFHVPKSNAAYAGRHNAARTLRPSMQRMSRPPLPNASRLLFAHFQALSMH